METQNTIVESFPAQRPNITSHWERELVSIVAKTPCRTSVLASVTSFSGEMITTRSVPPNQFGEISFSTAIHRTKQRINIDLKCELDSGNHWQRYHILNRNQKAIPQLYSPTHWQADEDNSVCFLDAIYGQVEIDIRNSGGLQNTDGFYIGDGKEGEWKTHSKTILHQPLQCILVPSEKEIAEPQEVRIRLRTDELERELRRLIRPKPSIWVSIPQKIQRGVETPLQIKVDSPSSFAMIDLQIQHGNKKSSHKLPLSEQGQIRFPFQARYGGIYELTASFGSVQTKLAFWVEGKQRFSISSAFGLSSTSEDFGWLLEEAKDLPEYTDHSTPFPAQSRDHRPQYLRIGDQAQENQLHWTPQNNTKEESSLLPEANFSNTSGPTVLLSPSDSISLETGTTRVYNQSSQKELHLAISSQPYYLTTDSHFSTQRISELLPEIFLPHHPQTDARFLLHAAVTWDSLATQKTPWFDMILERAKENLAWLPTWYQEHGWNNPEIDLEVIQALIVAYRAGLSPNTSFFLRAIDHVCTGKNEPRWAHLRWELQQSQLDLFPCVASTRPIWHEQEFQSPQTEKEWEMWLLQKLYAEDSQRSIPELETISALRTENPWLDAAIWRWEYDRYQSYHNLRLSLSSSDRTIAKGLFHTWQRKNIFSSIETQPEQPPLFLEVDGIGSLHWGLWQFIPQQRAPSSQDGLRISRKLVDDQGNELSVSGIETGQHFWIEHHIQGQSNDTVSLSIFPPANLKLFAQESSRSRIHREILLDQNGEATLKILGLNLHKGSFQFPASEIRKDDMMAHSGDWIVQSR